MPLPLVTIVGRPNVGKSSLLNMLAGRRISIVEPTAGVTRDRIQTLCDHEGRYFELVDTDGRSVTEPLFAPNQFHRVEISDSGSTFLEFGPATLFVMLFTLGTIWGGFTLGITKAVRSGKRRD